MSILRKNSKSLTVLSKNPWIYIYTHIYAFFSLNAKIFSLNKVLKFPIQYKSYLYRKLNIMGVQQGWRKYVQLCTMYFLLMFENGYLQCQIQRCILGKHRWVTHPTPSEMFKRRFDLGTNTVRIEEFCRL